jgi:hypothetical protein
MGFSLQILEMAFYGLSGGISRQGGKREEEILWTEWTEWTKKKVDRVDGRALSGF